MPKKKVSAKVAVKFVKKTAKKVVKKGTARPAVKAATKKVAVKKAVPASTKPPKPTATKPDIAKPEPPKQQPAKPEASLGRPLVTQEEKLFMLFHNDYQARQVFEFLRVNTVKELEEFSPQQIIHMMSKPLRMTVDRIREGLAKYKRSLKDDSQFAADFQKKNEQ